MVQAGESMLSSGTVAEQNLVRSLCLRACETLWMSAWTNKLRVLPEHVPELGAFRVYAQKDCTEKSRLSKLIQEHDAGDEQSDTDYVSYP
eukprot:1160113-Pelagomonas_calceolata.AAC.1